MKEGWLLNITIESGDALKCPAWIRALSLGRQMRTYAVVSIDPADPADSITQIDKCGGSNPNWNCEFSYCLNKNLIYGNEAKDDVISIDIYCAALGLMTKDWLIGTATLGMEDVPINKCSFFRGLEVWRETKDGLQLQHAGWINIKTNIIPDTDPECETCEALRILEVARNCTECSICLEGLYIPEDEQDPSAWAFKKCGHIFHEDCLVSWCKTANKYSCPNCRTEVHQSDIVLV